jgi:hypothetical protein
MDTDNKSTNIQYCQDCEEELVCGIRHEDTRGCFTKDISVKYRKPINIYRRAYAAVDNLDKTSDTYLTDRSNVLRSFRSDLTELFEQKLLTFNLALNFDKIFFDCNFSNHWWWTYNCPNIDSCVNGRYVSSHGLATMRLMLVVVEDVDEYEEDDEEGYEYKNENEDKNKNEEEYDNDFDQPEDPYHNQIEDYINEHLVKSSDYEKNVKKPESSPASFIDTYTHTSNKSLVIIHSSIL